MFVLRTECDLTAEQKEILRSEFKARTGEDCVVLAHGFQIERIQLKKEQPLWRRLFRRS